MKYSSLLLACTSTSGLICYTRWWLRDVMCCWHWCCHFMILSFIEGYCVSPCRLQVKFLSLSLWLQSLLTSLPARSVCLNGIHCYLCCSHLPTSSNVNPCPCRSSPWNVLSILLAVGWWNTVLLAWTHVLCMMMTAGCYVLLTLMLPFQYSLKVIA